MIGQKSGAIINISSTTSVQNQPASIFFYCASKSGVNHLTRALAVRYAPYGIRANAVLPGAMDSPLIYHQIAGQFRNTAEMIRSRNAASPMGHMGTAWDVAHAALLLASEEAKYINRRVPAGQRRQGLHLTIAIPARCRRNRHVPAFRAEAELSSLQTVPYLRS